MKKKFFLVSTIIVLSLLISAQQGVEAVTSPEACTQEGGTWQLFFDGCADECEVGKNCLQVLTVSCNCGEGFCWNPQTQQCLPCGDVAVFAVDQQGESQYFGSIVTQNGRLVCTTPTDPWGGWCYQVLEGEYRVELELTEGWVSTTPRVVGISVVRNETTNVKFGVALAKPLFPYPYPAPPIRPVNTINIYIPFIGGG